MFGVLALLVVEIVKKLVKGNKIVNVEGVGVFARRRQVLKGRPVYTAVRIDLLVELEQIFSSLGSYFGSVVLLEKVILMPMELRDHGINIGAFFLIIVIGSFKTTNRPFGFSAAPIIPFVFVCSDASNFLSGNFFG